MAFGAQIKLSVDSSGRSKNEFRGQIQQLVDQISASNPVKLKTLKIELSQQSKQQLAQQIQSGIASKNYSIETITIKKIDASSAVENLRRQLQTMLSGLSITGLKEFLGDTASSTALDKATAAANKLAEAQEKVRQKTAETQAAAKELSTIQNKLNSAYGKSLDVGDASAAQSLAAAYRDLTLQIENAKKAQGEEQRATIANVSESVRAYKQKVDAILETQRASTKAADEERKAEQRAATLQRQTMTLQQQVASYINNNSRAYQVFGVRLDSLNAQLASGAAISKTELEGLKAEFISIQTAANEAGISGQTFFEKLKAGWEKFGGWSVVTKSMMTVIRGLRGMVDAVKDLDSAMTELRKVTDLTSEGYNQFYKEAVNVASDVGAKVSDTINATADFARLGFSVEDSTLLAAAALVYKNVGDGIEDISQATESLISTMKGFKIEAQDATYIIDAFNEVGNRFAISSTGIGDALQRSASALSAAGNTLEESIGLVVAANDVVQNPDQVGTALKTLTMYLRAAKIEAEEAGLDTEGMAESVSKLQAAILSLSGVDILSDPDTFKSTFQILKEISQVWADLSNTDQAALIELMGGKRNANVLISIIENFEDAEKAMQTALNSAGSAAQENKKWIDSIAGSINQLQREYEVLSQNVLGSDLVKNAVNLASGFLESINWIVETFGALPAVVSAATIALEAFGKSIKAVSYTNGTFKVFGQEINSLGDALKNIPQMGWNVVDFFKTFFSHLSNDEKALVRFNSALKTGVDPQKAFADNMGNASESARNMAMQIATGDATLEGFGISAAGATAKITLLDIGAKALSTTLNALVSFGISMAIQGLFRLATSMANAKKEAEEAAQAQVKNARETTGAVTEALQKYSELVEAYNDGALSEDSFVKSGNSVLESLGLQKKAVEELTGGYEELSEAILQTSLSSLKEAENGLLYDVGNKRDALTGAYSGFGNMGRSLIEIASTPRSLKPYQSYVDALNNAGYRTQADSEMGVTLSVYNGKDLKTIDGVLSAYEKLSGVLEIIKDTQRELGEEELPPFYNDIYEEWNRIKNLVDEYSSSLDALNKNIVAQAISSAMLANGIPQTQEEFNAFRNGVINAVEASGSFRVAVGDTSQAIKDMVDQSLAVYQFASEFAKGTDEASNGVAVVVMAADKLSDALKDLKANYDILTKAQKEMSENGGLSFDTLQSIAASLGEGENIVDYLYEENGVLKLNTQAWEDRSAAIVQNKANNLESKIKEIKDEISAIGEDNPDRVENLYRALEQYETELLVLQTSLKGVSEKKEEAFDPYDISAMTAALDTLQKNTSGLFDFLDKVQKGTEITEKDILDLVKQYPELSWRLNFEDLNVDDTASAVSEMLDRADEQYSQIIDDQIALLEGLRAEAEVRGYDVDLLDTMIKNLRVMRGLSIVDLWGSKTTPATVDPMTQFANSLKTLKSASSMLQSMREYNSGKEKASFIGMLQSVVDLANSDDLKDAGLNITDFIDMTTGAFKEVGAEKWIDALVKQLRALKDANGQQLIPDAIIEQLRLEALAAEEAEAAMSRLKTAHENVSAVIDTGNAISRNGQLTLSTFEQLIAVDSRYAYAVDYVNGKLTLNRDIFNQLTDSIMQETAAQADAEAMAIIMSDEYQQLAANIDNLSDKERSRLDDLNAEIMTYKVMANEIANATTARERFMNYSEGKSGYEGAQDALSVIQDVLENTKSSIYGQIGSDKFRLAADFVIGENVEVNTPEFEKAMKTIERYVTEDGQGILNFYNDLVSNGIVDATTGAMNTTIAEISEKLGISTEAARAFMEQLEKYQAQKFDWSALDPDQESKSAEDSLKKVKEAIEDVDKTVSDFKTNASEINIDPAPAVEAAGKISTALQGVIDKLLSIASNSKINVEINTTETTTTKTNTASGGIGGFFSSLFGRSAAGGTTGAAGGRTLVGELGPELTVDPKNGTWRVVGANGPEFVNLPAGSIVIDAKQTAAAFKNMSPSGKGKSMASGTASAILNGVIAIGGTLLGKLLSGKTSTATTSTVAATTTSNVSGNTVAKPEVSSSKKSSGSSSSTAKATESVTKAVEKQKTAYELLNEQIEHLIEHQEQLYKEADRAFDYTGMQRSLEEQARLYQKMMENSYVAVDDMKRQGKTDTDEELQDMERKAWEAWENMYDTYDKIRALRVDALNDKIDDLQKGYANLQTIADQMSKNGGISIDAFQALTDHGLQYLSMLENVDGQYKINEDAVKRMIAAEKEQMAIETALSYISSIREALQDGEANRLNALVNVTQQISNNTWDAVYAQAELLKNIGLSNEQYDQVIFNISAIRNMAGSVITDLSHQTNTALDDQKSALDKILEYTKQLVESEVRDRIKAIEKEVKAYRKIVDLKKESLKTSREQEQHDRKVSDKVKEIAKIQSQIDQLSLDDSRAAQAERAKLVEELAKLQTDLSDYQSDYAYDRQTDMLDKMADQYEESRQTEIERLENSISSAEKIYQMAIERIRTSWQSLYNDLIAWNTEQGNSINQDITENWNLACAAVERYGNYLNALKELCGLDVDNQLVATLPKYHGGGTVDGRGAINDKEVMAVLNKDELVVDQKQKKGLYRLIDFQKALSEKLGTAIGNIRMSGISAMPSPALAGAAVGGVSTMQNVVFSPSINVEISHSGDMDSRDARRYGDEIADTTIDRLYNAFTQRGVSGIFGTKLKQV